MKNPRSLSPYGLRFVGFSLVLVPPSFAAHFFFFVERRTDYRSEARILRHQKSLAELFAQSLKNPADGRENRQIAGQHDILHLCAARRKHGEQQHRTVSQRSESLPR